MDCRVRAAHPDDAPVVSEVILAALRETNARDYTASVIERQSFSPDAVRALIGKRKAIIMERSLPAA